MPKQYLTYRPWVLFAVLLVPNLLMSYAPLSLPSRLWVLILGILTPLLCALLIARGDRTAGDPPWFSWALKDDPNAGKWLSWVLAGGLAMLLFSRFYRFTTIPSWPIADESWLHFTGYQQSLDWKWQILWGESRVEPMGVWMTGFFFKWAGISNETLRLFPVIVNLLTVCVAFWACRRFFSDRFTLLYMGFLAFSFWFFVFSRMGLDAVTAPPFEFMVIGLLAARNDSRKDSTLQDMLTGLVMGLGFYTYPAWMGFAFFVFWMLLLMVIQRRWTFRAAATILAMMSATLVPLITARLMPNGTPHWVYQLNPGLAFKQLVAYPYGIMWNGQNMAPYASVWGGMLNGLAGALFLTGLVELARFRRFRYAPSLVAALAILMSPGLCSSNWQALRTISFLPFAIGSCAVGTIALAVGLPRQWRGAALALLCVSSAVLDAYHYFGKYVHSENYPSLHRYWRLPDWEQAYRIIRRETAPGDPVIILDNFNLRCGDFSLMLATHPFNAAANPELDLDRCRVAYLVMDPIYETVLRKRFPDLEATPLVPGSHFPDLRLALFRIPLDAGKMVLMRPWIEANTFLMQIHRMTISQNQVDIPWAGLRRELEKGYGLFKNDRFLRAIYWEQELYFSCIENDLHRIAQVCQRAREEGYVTQRLEQRMKMVDAMLKRLPDNH